MIIFFQIQVAVKILSQQRVSNTPSDFLKEAALLQTINNEYIVRFFGVVLDSDALMLVTKTFFYLIP